MMVPLGRKVRESWKSDVRKYQERKWQESWKKKAGRIRQQPNEKSKTTELVMRAAGDLKVPFLAQPQKIEHGG